MKLLSLKEARSQSEQDERAIAAKTNMLGQQLNKAVASFNKEKEKQDVERKLARAVWERELENFQEQLRDLTRDTEECEERRRVALLPLVSQAAELQRMKEEHDNNFITLLQREKELISHQEAVKNAEASLTVEQREFAMYRLEQSEALEQEKKSAKEELERSRKASREAKEDVQKLVKAHQVFTEREQSAKRAEDIARAAMESADRRIELERIEQRKTDDKRKMLALTISELKKRGLWHKQ